MELIQISWWASLIVSWLIVIGGVWLAFEIVVRLIVWLQDFRHGRRVIKRMESLSPERLEILNAVFDRFDGIASERPVSDDRREAAIRYDPSLAEILRKDK